MSLQLTKIISLKFKVDLIERRSRRDMSPQGRKRVAGMVSRDYQTVSGIGGGSQNYQQVSRTQENSKIILLKNII